MQCREDVRRHCQAGIGRAREQSAEHPAAHVAAGVWEALVPAGVDGKLQASLGEFAIDNRSGVSKFLPLEFVLRGVLEQEIRKLNGNPKFYKAPKPFIDEKFGYEKIVGTTRDDRVVITAHYRAKGKEAALKRVVDRVRSEGISAEGVKQ